MNVAECLLRARACVEMANKASGENTDKLLEIAKAWLELAQDTAKELSAEGRSSSLSEPGPLSERGAEPKRV